MIINSKGLSFINFNLIKNYGEKIEMMITYKLQPKLKKHS
jgi:hypothetical protein